MDEGGDGYNIIRVVGYFRPVTTADGDSTNTVRRWSGWTPFDALFVAVVAGAVAFYLVVSRQFFMSGDDWRYLDQGLSLHGLFAPYNEHLTFTALATYQVIAHIFGLGSYLPFRILGVSSAAAVAITLYLIVRDRIGPTVAVFVGVSMLFFPNLLIAVSAFNHYVAFIMIAIASWLLTLDNPKRDLPIFLAITVAICSSGVSIAGVAGCLAYLLITWAPWRRWLSVLVPLIGWLVWSVENPKTPTTTSTGSFAGAPSYVLRGLESSFRGLAFDNRLLGWCLAALFVANLMRRLRKGPRAAAHELSWTAASIAWWAGLAGSRSWLNLSVEVFRYRFIGAGFLILASLPRDRTHWAPRTSTRRTLGAGLTLAAVLAGVLNIGGIITLAHSKSEFTRSVKVTTAYLNLGPDYIPDDTKVNLGVAYLTAGKYRNLTAKFGRPNGTSPQSIDRFILEFGPARFVSLLPNAARNCEHRGNTVNVEPRSVGRASVVLRTLSGSITVKARMVNAAWIPITTLSPGMPGRVSFPSTPLNRPWQVDVGRALVCSE